MGIAKAKFEKLIKASSFKELFNELGWDRFNNEVSIEISGHMYVLKGIAEKKGFGVFECAPAANGKVPDRATRRMIDNKLSKQYFEHLIIFTNQKRDQQEWQLIIREPNKPAMPRTATYYTHQTPQELYQKLGSLFISLDDEDNISLVDIKQKVSEQFNANAEKVTKKFYTDFKAQHTAFMDFIEGISELVDQEWYASLMLNRLMFIYFIQKQGFLDGNENYLQDKLKEVESNRGKNQFYNFYSNFLLKLFHEGLNEPHHKELEKEIGRVPYLNGGLFDVHEIEKEYKSQIQIKDEAFKALFNFFDKWNWHLDNRVEASGKDINPDVIGYIFEKYINDRADMGAYYTKEDITEYIGKNTILPYLFERAKEGCANAFSGDSSLWKMLQDDPDRYIYGAVKHGIRLTPQPLSSRRGEQDRETAPRLH